MDQIAKWVILHGRGSGHLLLFLTAGGNQVDAAKASGPAGEALGKADAALIRAWTGFAIGRMAPVGHLRPLLAFLDPRLPDFPQVWAAAGTPRHIFAIPPARLMAITRAVPTDFAA